MHYDGQVPHSGPIFTGCRVSPGNRQRNRSLVLRFDAAALVGERVEFSPANTVAKESTALYVLVNETARDADWLAAMRANHELPACRGGDCPDQMHARYRG